MAQNQVAISTENLLGNWNAEFPDHLLTVEDLKKPIPFIKALFKIFERLGIDTDAVVQPPPEKELNDHLPYYRDLVTVINVTRVIHHLIKGLPQQMGISINHVLQPSQQSSMSILLLLFNLMLFYETRLNELAPREDQLFQRTKMVEELEEKKNQLQEQLNNKAREKGERASRVEKMNQEIMALEEQLQLEQQNRDKTKQDLEAIRTKNENTQKLLDQKKARKDTLLTEKERLKALRVYDAEEIKAKAAEANQKVQEAEKKLSNLGAVIAQKENSLNILQTKIKPSMDTANHLLEEISNLKQDVEFGDLDSDSKDGELQMLNTTEVELNAKLAEIKAERDEAAKQRRDAQEKREQERLAFENAIRENEEKASKREEFMLLATQRTNVLKENTKQYEKEKQSGTEELQAMKDTYDATISEWEEALYNLVESVKTDLFNKLRKLHGVKIE